MTPEYIVLSLFFVAVVYLYLCASNEWRKEREMLLQMADIERQRLLDRIQARDLPEYKALQVDAPNKKEPKPDELIPL
jgi:cytidylate kinase